MPRPAASALTGDQVMTDAERREYWGDFPDEAEFFFDKEGHGTYQMRALEDIKYKQKREWWKENYGNWGAPPMPAPWTAAFVEWEKVWKYHPVKGHCYCDVMHFRYKAWWKQAGKPGCIYCYFFPLMDDESEDEKEGELEVKYQGKIRRGKVYVGETKRFLPKRLSGHRSKEIVKAEISKPGGVYILVDQYVPNTGNTKRDKRTRLRLEDTLALSFPSKMLISKHRFR